MLTISYRIAYLKFMEVINRPIEDTNGRITKENLLQFVLNFELSNYACILNLI